MEILFDRDYADGLQQIADADISPAGAGNFSDDNYSNQAMTSMASREETMQAYENSLEIF